MLYSGLVFQCVLTLLLEVLVNTCGEKYFPEEDTQTNNFKYGHKLSLLSAVGIEGCFTHEKFTVCCR